MSSLSIFISCVPGYPRGQGQKAKHVSRERKKFLVLILVYLHDTSVFPKQITKPKILEWPVRKQTVVTSSDWCKEGIPWTSVLCGEFHIYFCHGLNNKEANWLCKLNRRKIKFRPNLHTYKLTPWSNTEPDWHHVVDPPLRLTRDWVSSGQKCACLMLHLHTGRCIGWH